MTWTLTYNSVAVTVQNFETYEETALYDESTDQIIGTQYTIGIVGTIISGGSTLAEQISTYRTKLSQPRKALSLTCGGNSVLDISETSLNLPDAFGGPKPEVVQVQEVFGSGSAIVAFRVQAFQQIVDGANHCAVTTHRFEVSVNRDENNYEERVVRGFIRTRDDKRDGDDALWAYNDAENETNPDKYRLNVVPPLLQGFRREAQEFVVAYDGRSLAYQIRDKEHYRSFGPYATSGRGFFSLRMSDMGAKWIKELTIELGSTKGMDKKDVMRGCVQVLTSKFRLSEGYDMLLQFSVTEDLFANTVQLQAIAETNFADKEVLEDATLWPSQDLSGLFTEVQWDPNIETPDTFPTLGPYGHALVMSVKQQFYDAAVSQFPAHASSDYTIPLGAVANVQTVTNVGVTTNTDPVNEGKVFDRESYASGGQQKAPYIEALATRSYIEDGGIVPVSIGPVGSGNAPPDMNLTLYWQVREPTVTIIERGYAVRNVRPPLIPKPKPPVGAAVISARMSPGQPKAVADQSRIQYRAEWEYVYHLSVSAMANALNEVVGFDTDGYALPGNGVQWKAAYNKLKNAYSPQVIEGVGNDTREPQDVEEVDESFTWDPNSE